MRTSMSLWLLALTGVASALTATLATSAQASPSGGRGAAAPVVPVAPHSTSASASFAGYRLLARDGSWTVTASFTVPTVRCTTAARAIAASAGLQANNGTVSSASLVIGCGSGVPVFYPSLVLNGKVTNLKGAKVSPGDVIILTASSSGSPNYVQVANQTTKVAARLTFAPNLPWIGDDGWSVNGHLLRVPDFGSLRYYNCSVDGSPISSYTWHLYNRVESPGITEISTGAIGTGNGSGFTTTFKFP